MGYVVLAGKMRRVILIGDKKRYITFLAITQTCVIFSYRIIKRGSIFH